MKLAFHLSLLSIPVAVSAAPSIQFNRDIRPIVSEYCFHCHGPDPGSRKAGLRLDTKEGFFEKTDKRGPTVVIGKPLESPLYQRVMSTDVDEVMPPPEAHKVLTSAQKDLLKRWIEEGASWQPHWSFIKPERPPVPATAGTKNHAWAKHPIDAFLFEKLAAAGLEPAAQADRRTLARRASLDVTGLPPSSTAVEAFVADTSPNAWEKYIDTLLASPQWGEHRGRYWLDAARYADTHGLHFDNYREMWPYRDWVIAAFNKNMPFNTFTLEQLAGDLLPNPTQSQLVATGFHRCNITTNEGGTIEEENLAGYARDRVETTSWVWLGLTANCAVCHDHKFDPISAKDFYRMSAYFRNTVQGGLDGNVKDSNPSIIVPLSEDLARYDMLESEISKTRGSIQDAQKSQEGIFTAWAAKMDAASTTKALVPASQSLHIPLNEGKGKKLTVTSQSGKQDVSGELAWDAKGEFGPALQLKDNTDVQLPSHGDFERDQPFSISLWVKAEANRTGALIAKMDKQEAGFRGWDVFLQNGEQIALHLIHSWPQHALKVATGNVLSRKKWHHVVVSYDGSQKASGVKIFIDGGLQPLKTDTEGALVGTTKTDVPLRLGRRQASDIVKGASIQDVRLFSSALAATEVASLRFAPAITAVASLPAEKRDAKQNQLLKDYYFAQVDGRTRDLAQQIITMEAERKGIEARGAVTHIQMERGNAMPTAFVLNRGNYDQKGEKVEPGPFSALHALPEKSPANRLGLAEWILSPENPLTARVTVNRFWQEVFGTGIVKTSEDLGIVGDAPSHPELLDWLAVEFVAQGWDVKKFFKLLLTSQAYQQSAVATPLKQEKDQFNRLLSRGPRFRMDAEMVRDSALAASGLLVPTLGGPSVRPYQPPGVWEAVAMPESNTRNYKADKGAGLYRRSVYTFWKRAAPPASMEIFNATAREVSCLRRERSNTPLQALVTMNDIQFMEASRVLATNVLKSSFDTEMLKLQMLAHTVLSRPLRQEELSIVQEVLQDQLTYYATATKDAQALVAYGETPVPAGVDVPKLAAWTMVANKLMNLDEVLNK